MARTNKDRKVYICATPQPIDLNQAAYEALTWIEVSNVGAVGEAGTNTNIVSYDELSTDVTQKGKGIANAGDPTIECARNPTDPGQLALRAAAKTNFNYAVKFEDKDAPTANHTNSVYYNRGLVTGPTRPNGRNEDFILEVFTLALNQREIVVDPQSLVVPTNAALPSITGASLAQGAILTAQEGIWTGNPTSFTYQWQADTSGNGTFTNIGGATSKPHALAAGQSGDAVRVGVVAVNPAGASSVAYSLPVGLVGA
ncbi:hypothetical protein GGQ99_001288 [Aminobacter niigataensis]|uniref:Major tail protein n=1 Tax=Aminobacter niigataensis TaxID=83265 RepID=A0ABR6KYS4_9HYPH|nr:hypothetical protein [Aminobacter niigataensis]MBB4649566.1 hypothetical protein [Aminobacter niigataensis]